MEIPPAAYSCSRGDLMLKTYELYLNEHIVGSVYMEKSGLYWQITCKCNLPGTGIYRVRVLSNTTQTDLGICVPLDSCFGIKTRIPAKYLGEGELSFLVVSQEQEKNNQFIPIDSQRPFDHISRLRNAYLAYRDGIQGIVISE